MSALVAQVTQLTYFTTDLVPNLLLTPQAATASEASALAAQVAQLNEELSKATARVRAYEVIARESARRIASACACGLRAP